MVLAGRSIIISNLRTSNRGRWEKIGSCFRLELWQIKLRRPDGWTPHCSFPHPPLTQRPYQLVPSTRLDARCAVSSLRHCAHPPTSLHLAAIGPPQPRGLLRATSPRCLPVLPPPHKDGNGYRLPMCLRVKTWLGEGTSTTLCLRVCS